MSKKKIRMGMKLDPPKSTEEDMVLKVQKPMMGGGPALIYNEDRSVFGYVDMTPDMMMLMGTEFKIYVLGHIDKNGILVVKEELSWQPW